MKQYHEDACSHDGILDKTNGWVCTSQHWTFNKYQNDGDVQRGSKQHFLVKSMH